MATEELEYDLPLQVELIAPALPASNWFMPINEGKELGAVMRGFLGSGISIDNRELGPYLSFHSAFLGSSIGAIDSKD